MARERRDTQRRLHFGTLLRLSPQAIVVLDADGCVREWNPATVSLLGWTREDLIGRPFEAILGEQDRLAFVGAWQELQTQRRATPLISDRLHHDRSWLPVEIMMAPIQDSDGSFGGVVATLSRAQPATAPSTPAATSAAAATDDSRPGERAVSVWELDEVTGLPGRRWLQRRLLAELPQGLHRAVALVDVDAFALVNQVYGHEAGDQVLAELAQRFAAACAPAVVGRWQADEFLVIVDAVAAGAELDALLQSVASAARYALVLAQDEIRLTASAGWCTSAAVPLASLFTSASAALASAKAHGRDRIVVFDESTMPTALHSGLRMAHDLQRGLTQDELRLHYQPIVDLAANDVVGVEALVRWERPGVGLLAPAAFIDVAERTGQVVALGEWVIRTACQAAATFAATRLAPLRVSINVSARQLSDPGFLGALRAALESTGCDPGGIVLEVTETALLHDLGGAAATLDEVRALGLELDLDDFGTGYSSLLYLKHLPVDRIKIDQAFIAGLGSDVADTAIVASTIALAHSMGNTAVAEGVETVQQLGLLREMGCDFAQGYLISRPLPHDELIRWLGKQTPSRLLDRNGVPGTAPGAAHRPQPPGQDRRDSIADRRDEDGDLRDLAGDARDQEADRRDSENDLRDRAWDRREALADVAVDPSAEAGHDRARDAADRARAAARRSQARLERDQAHADRDLQLSAREQARDDRSPRRPDRAVAALDRSTQLDPLTGAYRWPSGQPFVESQTEQALQAADTVAVVHVRLAGHDATGRALEQLAEDSALIVVANALGAVLRPADLLIRTRTRDLVCLLRGLSVVEVEQRVAAVTGDLAAVPHLAVRLTIGSAVLQDGETITDAMARAAGPRSQD